MPLSVVILAAGRVMVSDTLQNLCRTPTPSLTVNVQGSTTAFVAGLNQQGYDYELLGPQQVRVPGKTEELSRVLWSTAIDTGCVIRNMTPSRNSLEQIFLDAVKQVRNAHS